MSEDRQQMVELIQRVIEAHGRSEKKHMEFSKKLMIFASIMYAATWVVAAASWVLWREFPAGLIQYTTWLYSAATAFYMCKTGYENKAKIQGAKGERETWKE